MRRVERILRNMIGLAVVDQADRALRRTCMGRIVSMMVLLSLFFCGCSYIALTVLFYRSGIGKRLPETCNSALAMLFCLGFLAALVFSGLVGNWLRGRFWRTLRRRRRW